jgi:hypothetical protein
LEQQTKRNSEDRTAKRILAPYLVQLQSAWPEAWQRWW